MFLIRIRMWSDPAGRYLIFLFLFYGGCWKYAVEDRIPAPYTSVTIHDKTGLDLVQRLNIMTWIRIRNDLKDWIWIRKNFFRIDYAKCEIVSSIHKTAYNFKAIWILIRIHLGRYCINCKYEAFEEVLCLAGSLCSVLATTRAWMVENGLEFTNSWRVKWSLVNGEK